MLTRRQFTLALAAGTLGPAIAAHAHPRVVVIGAGAAGLRFVQELERWVGRDHLDVQVIDPASAYRPPFGVSRVLSGLLPAAEHAHDYAPVLGARHRRARVRAIDRSSRHVLLDDGSGIQYDALVVAPGLVPAQAVPGLEHLAWFNDDSLATLIARLDAVPAGGSVIVTAPDLPYRCPPAPYERATLFADYLSRQGKSDVHLTILDAKERFSLQAHYLNHWETAYRGRIEWLPPSVHDGIVAITPEAVVTGFDEFEADLVLAVPQQRAPDFCHDAGLADFTGFCPVEPISFRSRVDDAVYCIGDIAKAGLMPKSASAAQAQATRAARDLAARLGALGNPPDNRLESHCYSVLAQDFAISSHGHFDVDDGRIQRIGEDLSHYPPDSESGSRELTAAQDWYARTLAAMGL